jgi:hypothetical protein
MLNRWNWMGCNFLVDVSLVTPSSIMSIQTRILLSLDLGGNSEYNWSIQHNWQHTHTQHLAKGAPRKAVGRCCWERFRCCPATHDRGRRPYPLVRTTSPNHAEARPMMVGDNNCSGDCGSDDNMVFTLMILARDGMSFSYIQHFHWLLVIVAPKVVPWSLPSGSPPYRIWN